MIDFEKDENFQKADEEAFYRSGLVASGSFIDMDEYDQDAVIRYGQLMYEYGTKSMITEQQKRQEAKELEEREKARAYQFPIGKVVPALRQEED